ATMIERARAEAEGIVRQAESDAAALVERRTRMAEDKIAAAERSAVDEVRAKAAGAAAAAAERLLRERLDGGADKAMVDAAIAELGQR
ncbi:MAG TPA: F0F1 ATP synthase subunit B, partial [Allosphingosinicella sp.]|nr:F0F1 ATP synthase subunit B [Allosphingosinicella sp.]